MQNNQQRQYNETLKTIGQFSFPMNHLLIFQLIQRTPNQNQRDYKEKFMFMVTFIQGINQQGGRTYDWKSGRHAQKFATREIAGLAEVLHQCGIGNDLNVLPYSKFSRSGNSQKQLTVWVSTKQQQIAGQTVNVRTINLTFTVNKVKNSFALTASEALSMSKMLTGLYEKAIQLEIDNFVGQPFQQNESFQYGPSGNQGFQPNHPQGNNPNNQFNPNNQNNPPGQQGQQGGFQGNQIQNNMNQQPQPGPGNNNPYGN